jgi:hypothetical protein
MKPNIRRQSQILLLRGRKPDHPVRIRPVIKLNFMFRPVNRFGEKPQLTTIGYQTSGISR